MSEIVIPPDALEHYRLVAKTIEDARVSAEVHSKLRHERFNVFTTLLKEHDEVRLHTRFIHCLLDPKGNHDCGSRFLELFFETLADHPGLDHADQKKLLPARPPNQWVVQREASRSPYGQIDVLLEQANCFGIAVENKIYANEQHEQLESYWKYLTEKFGENAILLYLTIHGKKSEANKINFSYVRISYVEHILAWLDKCLWETTRITAINQVLLQYREVVRQITGKTASANTMNDIIKFISKNPDILRYRAQMNQAIDVKRQQFLNELAELIVKELRSKRYVIEGSTLFGRMGEAIIITPLPNTNLNQLGFKVWIEHFRVLIIGLKFPNGYKVLPPEHCQILDAMNVILDKSPKSRELRYWEWNEGWPTQSFKLIDQYDDIQLADLIRQGAADTASELCGTIYSCIELLEKACIEAKSPPAPSSSQNLQ